METISFSNFPLLSCKGTIYFLSFLKIDLVSFKLSLLLFLQVLFYSLGFSPQAIMLSANKDTFISFSPNCMPFSFPYLRALAKNVG